MSARTAAHLARETYDLLVIGGGVAGCGVALDAASRGLRVVVVESQDIGYGTSSRSSKLIHGGVRYLEQLRFGLVRQALAERRLLQERLAPHLVTGVAFLYPLTHPAWERAYVGAGLALYDVLAGRTGLPGHRHLSRARTLATAPALDPKAVTGSVQYYDGRVDDARLTLALALTAERFGARLAVRTRAESIARDDDVIRVRTVDTLTGADDEFRTHRVITAAGPWTAQLYGQLNLPVPPITTSKGVHLVLDADRIDAQCGVITRTANSVLFLIPWHDHWLVGTTDTPWDGSPDAAAATVADVEYLLEQANRILARPLSDRDVLATYAGLRPLVGHSGARRTSRLSREHVVAEQAPGIYSLVGGKLTTYRVMAKDAVDAAFHDLGIPASRTHQLPLVGATLYRDQRLLGQRVSAAADLTADAVTRLLQRYGDQTADLLACTGGNPWLREPIDGAPRHIRAEVLWAVRRERAESIADVLMRRTRIALETADHGRRAAREVADIMAAELGWAGARVAEEIDAYHHELARAAGAGTSRVMTSIDG